MSYLNQTRDHFLKMANSFSPYTRFVGRYLIVNDKLEDVGFEGYMMRGLDGHHVSYVNV